MQSWIEIKGERRDRCPDGQPQDFGATTTQLIISNQKAGVKNEGLYN